MKVDTIRTERLSIRELEIHDFASVHEIKSNAEVVKYLTWGPNTAEQTMNSLQKQIGFQTMENRKIYVLAVVKKETNECIGNVLFMIRDEDGQIAEIGYFLHPRYWNKGYGKEVVMGLQKFGFEQKQFHRIYATCDVENIGSQKVLVNAGFRQEGHLKEDLFVKGEWRDNYLFAMLNREYNQLVQTERRL